MGTTEPEGRPDPIVAPLSDVPVVEPEPEPEDTFDPEPVAPRTRRWPVQERMGRVRLLAQGLFVSAGLASAFIVTHFASSAPAPATTTTHPGVAPTTSTGATPAPPAAPPTRAPATTTTRAPVATTVPAPVTTTVPAPVTTTTVCYTTPSGQTLCN